MEPTSREYWYNLSLDLDTPAQIATPEPKALVDEEGRETLLYENGITADKLARQLQDSLLIEVVRRGDEVEHVSWDEKDDIHYKDPGDYISELCGILTWGGYSSVGLTSLQDGEATTHFLDICQSQQNQDNQTLLAKFDEMVTEIDRREGEHSYTGACQLTIHKPDTYYFYACKEKAEMIDESMGCYVPFFAYL